jgi:hypothetical protein
MISAMSMNFVQLLLTFIDFFNGEGCASIVNGELKPELEATSMKDTMNMTTRTF